MKRIYENWTWGFTGSRTGWTDPQRASVEELWDKLPPTVLHHGDCIGSDFNAHYLALAHDEWDCYITVHPPINPIYRAWCTGPRVVIRETFPYYERNRNIVTFTKVYRGRGSLLATPNSFGPVPHSGTWMTIQMAASQSLPTVIVYPDGRVEYIQPTKLLASLVGLDLKAKTVHVKPEAAPARRV